MDERAREIEAYGRAMARLERLLEQPLAIAREHSTAGDLDYVTQQLLAARNEARRRAGDYRDEDDDESGGTNLPRRDIAIYAEADRLVIYDDGVTVDTRSADPSRKTTIARIQKPGYMDEDDISEALAWINARQYYAGGYTIIDMDTLEVLESSTYSAI